MKGKACVIAYDISCDKRRRKVFKCLKVWQLDRQYSLFECKLTQSQAEELFLQLTELIKEEEDTLMLVWLDNYRDSLAVTENTIIGFQLPACYAG